MTIDCIVGSGTVSDRGGGIASVARLSIRALADGGWTPHVISFLDRGSHETAPGIGVAGCSGSKLLFATRVQRAVSSRRFSLYDALGVSRAHPHWRTRSPMAVWIHGVEVWRGLTPAYAKALRRADFVFCNTQATLDRHQQLHGPLPTAHVCWLATEADDAPGALANFTGPPTALIVSRIDATEGQKGHRELIAAWPNVIAAIPDARLLIVGGGSGLDAMRADVARSSAAHAIDVPGFVGAVQLPVYLRRAHVFAMPSRQEGFGIVYAEAMRYGLPCIASRQDAGQDVNVDGVTGYNVDLARPEELTERLIALLGDADHASSLGRNGHARWQKHFRRSCFADRFQTLWRNFTEDTGATMGAADRK